MQDFLNFLKDQKFTVPNPTLDGRVQRFDRAGKLSGWMIGWQCFAQKNGKSFIVAMCGDWKTNEQHKYVPKMSSRADNEVIRTHIASAQKKIAKEKASKATAAAAKAREWLPTLPTHGSTPYTLEKGLGSLHGARVDRNMLIVPVSGPDGLRGYQRIMPDGTKRFATGTPLKGSCFRLGQAIADVVYITEGYATAASVHDATGLPVVCAFNAQNLSAVAMALRAAHPIVQIIIAGDDDAATPGNPGRTEAEQAATLAQGSVVFPAFKDAASGTDFNDLASVEGIDVVRQQLRPEQARSKAVFIPLGYDEGTHFFYIVANNDIVKFSAATPIQFCTLAPKEYWDGKYAGDKGKIDWMAALEDLVRMSRARGPFDYNRVRGSGVWRDDGRTVVNTGCALYVDGISSTLSDLKSHYVYIQTAHKFPALATPLQDGKPLIDACMNFKWAHEQNGVLLAGWLAVARIASALPIRPHIWLTGGKDTGKSFCLDELVSYALGDRQGRVTAQGSTTEAGIRQTLKTSALPVIFDEFEVSEKTMARVLSTIELLRSTWSATDGQIIKGSGSGTASRFSPAFAAMVSSIRMGLNNDADRSRFCELELAPHGNDLAHYKKLKKLVDAITVNFGEALFARSCTLVEQIKESHKVFSDALATKISRRYGQQVGMLLAGYWSLTSNVVVTVDDAEKLVAEMDLAEAQAEATVVDHDEALEHLLTTMIRISSERSITIGEALEQGLDQNLRSLGIKYDRGFLIIANSHAELAKIFAKTRWQDNWKQAFKRLNGAKSVDRQSFGSRASRSRAVSLPFSLVKK